MIIGLKSQMLARHQENVLREWHMSDLIERLPAAVYCYILIIIYRGCMMIKHTFPELWLPWIQNLSLLGTPLGCSRWTKISSTANPSHTVHRAHTVKVLSPALKLDTNLGRGPQHLHDLLSLNIKSQLRLLSWSIWFESCLTDSSRKSKFMHAYISREEMASIDDWSGIALVWSCISNKSQSIVSQAISKGRASYACSTACGGVPCGSNHQELLKNAYNCSNCSVEFMCNKISTHA